MTTGPKLRPEDLKTWRSERRRTVRSIKTRLGCCHCRGRFPHYGLDFHHLNPAEKGFTIARNMYCAWNTLLEELEKCTVLCRICHAGVTCGEVALDTTITRAWTYSKKSPWR